MKKQVFINIIASIIAFFVQMLISFGLTPVLVNTLGEEAYGFIGLANNFVTYATVLTVAINSIAGRFISIAYNKGEIEKANSYYSSLFFANVILSFIVFLLSIVITIQLHHLIQIPQMLTYDVKITFLLVFINFIFSLFHVTFQVVPFVKNKVSLVSIVTAICNILKVIVILCLFAILQPKIYYIAIATLAYSITLIVLCICISKKLSSELKIDIHYFDWKSVKTLFVSGIWNSINNLSRIILVGFDLLIANIFINAYSMGILSIAKNIPSAIETLLATLSLAFVPNITILYAKNKLQDVISEVKFSMKIIALLMIVPVAGFIVFGTDFYMLWLNKSANEVTTIQLLSILTLIPYMFSICNFTLPNVDTVTNKLKRASIFTLIMSILTLMTEIVVLKTTNLGVVAIAGISSFYWIIKIVVFNPLNAAKNLDVKWYTFYPEFLKSFFYFCFILLIYLFLYQYVSVTSWKDLILYAMFFATIGYVMSFLLILNKKEKQWIYNKFLKKSFGKWNNVNRV